MRSSARIVAKAINPTNPAPPVVHDLPARKIVVKPKPTPHLGASCAHTCLDKATCKHSCCNIVGEREHCDGLMNDGSVNDIAVYLLDFLPLKDLLRLRQVSKVWMKMIDGSAKYRKAAFLEAEAPKDTKRGALLEQNPTKPGTGEERPGKGLLTFIPGSLSAITVPIRTFRINGLLFLNGGLDSSRLLEPLREFASPLMNDKSTCMEMFLTQPPVKELYVEGRIAATEEDDLPGTWRPRPSQVLLAADRDGLRFRDLYNHFTSSRDTQAGGPFRPAAHECGQVPLHQLHAA